MSIRAQSACRAIAIEDMILANGSKIGFRPLDPDDRDGLMSLFGRLSAESRHRRFLSPKRELTRAEAGHLAGVDHVRHEAIAAVDQRDGAIVGVSRYVLVSDQPRVADVSVAVADELQNMGIGTTLAGLLWDRARQNAIAALTATVLWENLPARRLMRRFGFRVCGSHGGTVDLRLDMEREHGRTRR